jgi:hypothetical protein
MQTFEGLHLKFLGTKFANSYHPFYRHSIFLL